MDRIATQMRYHGSYHYQCIAVSTSINTIHSLIVGIINIPFAMAIAIICTMRGHQQYWQQQRA